MGVVQFLAFSMPVPETPVHKHYGFVLGNMMSGRPGSFLQCSRNR